MKKILLLFSISFILIGCSNNDEVNVIVNDNNNIEPIKEEKIEEEKIDIGMYLYTGSGRDLIDNYETDFILNQDLVSIEVYNTTISSLSNAKQKDLWYQYYDQFKSLNPKIAYHIKFSTTDSGIIDKTIYSPSDTEDIYDYMQIYLYDDINQEDNTFYIHISEDEFNDNTILSSIKLTGSTKTDNINSDIELGAFMYTDINTDYYDTNNKYSVIISRK